MLSPLAGNGNEGSFLPVQLYAGESDIVTTYETVAAGFNVAQYAVLGRRADGKVVPWAPATSDEAGKLFAGGTITVASQPTAADTITINGIVITFEASGATGDQVNLGGTTTITAQNLQTFINANVSRLGVNSAGTANILTLIAEAAGAAGNAITLAKSGTNPTLSGATLTGGADNAGEAAMESRPMGIAMQAINATSVDVSGPVAIGGVFNHEALVWPSTVTTLLARKAAFDRSDISVKALFG
jgi:hypothetical protein